MCLIRAPPSDHRFRASRPLKFLILLRKNKKSQSPILPKTGKNNLSYCKYYLLTLESVEIHLIWWQHGANNNCLRGELIKVCRLMIICWKKAKLLDENEICNELAFQKTPYTTFSKGWIRLRKVQLTFLLSVSHHFYPLSDLPCTGRLERHLWTLVLWKCTG